MPFGSIATQPPTEGETYLGDGLYASYDGFQIKLRAGNGTGIGDQIVYLEPGVYANLVRFRESLG